MTICKHLQKGVGCSLKSVDSARVDLSKCIDEGKHTYTCFDPSEQDPDGITPGSPGAKLDAGKLKANLITDFSRALKAVIEVATFGANKYSVRGWLSVKDGIERYKDAEMRHKLEGMVSEFDIDSGLPHSWHHAWNVLAALELELREKDKK